MIHVIFLLIRILLVISGLAQEDPTDHSDCCFFESYSKKLLFPLFLYYWSIKKYDAFPQKNATLTIYHCFMRTRWICLKLIRWWSIIIFKLTKTDSIITSFSFTFSFPLLKICITKSKMNQNFKFQYVLRWKN